MKYISLLLAIALSACGGGGGATAPVTAPVVVPVVVKATDLRVIGNSLTFHLPLATIGWTANWGMAASSQAKDFSHVTAASLGIPVTTFNIAELERGPEFDATRIPEVTGGITSTTIVVVELGDNVSPEMTANFEPVYSKLLDSANKGLKLICLSTWWEYPLRDVIMKRQCEAHGGRYVYIGDIYVAADNPDRLETQWRFSPGVDVHPHDWGMAKIAERIVAAAK